jgi:CRP-like cAMP-binding protein
LSIGRERYGRERDDLMSLSQLRECCPEIFSGLSEAEFNELMLMKLKIPVRYERGDLIFQEGEFASGVYIICCGMVRVGKYYRGKRLTLELLKAGDILGIEALASEGPTTRPGYAQAIEDTKVAFIEKEAFLNFLREHPAITAALYQKSLEKIVCLQRKLVQSALASADERVAGILLELGQSCGTETRAGVSINVQFSRAELAELAGVSLETLIRSLSRLKHEGLIELHNHKGITILDPAGLEEMTIAKPILT